MTEDSKLLHALSEKLFELIYAGLKDQRGVHLETAITAAGLLAGFELQRAAKVDLSKLTPGQPVLGLPGVDESGPMVMTFIADSCRRGGIQEGPATGQAVPAANQPRETYLQLMQKFAGPYCRLTAALPAGVTLRWLAPAQVCVKFILAGQQALRSAIAQAVAIEAIVKGAKTVPPHGL